LSEDAVLDGIHSNGEQYAADHATTFMSFLCGVRYVLEAPLRSGARNMQRDPRSIVALNLLE